MVMGRAWSITWVKVLALCFNTFQPQFTGGLDVLGKVIMPIFIDDLL